MMRVRSCDLHTDSEQLNQLFIAYHVATGVRRYTTLARLQLLFSSRVWSPDDSRVWLTDDGHIAGLAFLWRRQPTSAYLALERLPHPARMTMTLPAEMLQWGIARATAIAQSQQTPLSLYASGFDAETDWAHLGFTRMPRDPVHCDVYFERALHADLPVVPPHPEYVIRPLDGVSELEKYRTLFGFAAVNLDHQRELLASAEYAHLVAVDALGEFIAYCEVSICRAEWALSNQRIGWVDYVETKANCQQQGIGRAILTAGLAQLRAWGAETAMLITINSNTPAVRLYERTGFQRAVVEEPASYEKRIGHG